MENTGMQPPLPVYLPRRGEEGDPVDIDTRTAQNENALNQNFSTLFQKVLEREARLDT